MSEWRVVIENHPTQRELHYHRMVGAVGWAMHEQNITQALVELRSKFDV